MRGRATLAALVVFIVFGAGCFGGSEEPDNDGSDALSADGEGDAMDSDADAAPEAVEPVTAARDLFFTDDGTLLLDAPEPGSGLPFEGGASAAAAGSPDGVLVATTELVDATVLLASDILVDLWIEADAPVVPNGAIDIGIYIGVDNGAMPFGTFGSISGPVTPDTPKQVTWTVPAADLWDVYLAPGDQVQAYLVTTAVLEGSNLRIMTGGEHASRLNVTLSAPYDPNLFPVSGENTERFDGTLTRGSIAGGPQEGQSFFEHEVTLGANTTFLELMVEQTGSGAADIDMTLSVGGSTVASSHTPHASERIRIAGPAGAGLSTATVIVRVELFSGANVGYSLDVMFND